MITVLEVLQSYGSDHYFNVGELQSKFPNVDAAELKTVLRTTDAQGLIEPLRANGFVEKLPRDDSVFYAITPAGRHHVMTHRTGQVARDILSELGKAS